MKALVCGIEGSLTQAIITNLLNDGLTINGIFYGKQMESQ